MNANSDFFPIAGRLNLSGAKIEQLFEAHAPRDRHNPAKLNVPGAVRQAIFNQTAVETIVLTADIRRSACILKESIDIPEYAKVLDDFVAEFRTVLSYHGGWFDKFTGDGFICYWLVDGSFTDCLDTVLDFSFSVMDNFRTYYYPAFVSNMRNVPSGIGLSIGVDAGPCYLTPIVGDLTIIGSPIVGSVRMSSTCQPYHLVLNAYPGSRLLDGMQKASGQLSDELSYKAATSALPTKEYPDGQVACTVEFFKKNKRVFY